MAAGPAWQVYDGVLYRVLKKRLGAPAGWPAGLDVLIVSARYGVIHPDRRIVAYDQILSDRDPPGRWARALRRAVAGRQYEFVHVNLGRAYLRAVGEVADLFPGAELTFATGGIGRRLAQTAAWVAARLSAG